MGCIGHDHRPLYRYPDISGHNGPGGVGEFVGEKAMMTHFSLRRWVNGFGYHNQVFYRAIKKYGWENIESKVLFNSLTQAQAEALEIELIRMHKSNDPNYGYNVKNGGNSIGCMDETIKAKISKAKKGNTVNSPETREKMSKARKGTKLSAETRRRIKEANTGQIRSKEFKERARQYALGNRNSVIPVNQFDLDGNFIKQWESASDPRETTGADPSHIIKCCKGKLKSTKGFVWQYTKDGGGVVIPNRIIKESICTSNEIDNLKPEEEVFFYRILVNCDDYGRMDARPPILRAKCFPLRIDKVKDKDIKAWINSLVARNLIFLYTVDGKRYLQTTTWEKHQQVRAKRSKFPAPDDGVINKIADEPVEKSDDSNGNQMQSDVPENPIQSLSLSLSESESKATKKSYAQFVKMTPDEHQKLIDQFGPIPTTKMIEILDNYKGASGKTYKSDYRAILTWVVNRWREDNGHHQGNCSQDSGQGTELIYKYD